MKQTKVELVAFSANPYNGKKLATWLLRYPRIIHAEAKAHKQIMKDMISYDVTIMGDTNMVKNSASSRAIPAFKMIKDVQDNMFTPIAWQKNHKGMQGTTYLTNEYQTLATNRWNQIGKETIENAEFIRATGVTKQLVNRVIEPFQYIDVLVTGTEWENFFELRCPLYFGRYRSWKDACVENNALDPEADIITKLEANESAAEIHIQQLAELMWDEFNSQTPVMLEPGEWHTPLVNKTDLIDELKETHEEVYQEVITNSAVCVSTARAARGSYGKWEGKTIKEDKDLHDSLRQQKHWSPFSHPCKCPTEEEYYVYSDTKYRGIDNKGKPIHEPGWYSEVHGFMPYRYLIERKLI